MLSGTVFTVTTYVFSIYIYIRNSYNLVFSYFCYMGLILRRSPVAKRHSHLRATSNSLRIKRYRQCNQSSFPVSVMKTRPDKPITSQSPSEGKSGRPRHDQSHNLNQTRVPAPSTGNTCKPGVRKIWRDIFQPVTKRKIINPKPSRNYFQHSTENCSTTKSTQYLSYLTTSV